MIISAMSDATSKRRQEERKSGRPKEFRQILEAEAKRFEDSRNMEGKAIGYSKSGQIYIGGIASRAYN